MSSYNKPPTVSDDDRAVEIYRKAAAIFHQRGYNATSMGDIAEIVDLTKGGLYYYIKGKEALLFAIMNFALDLLENEVLAKAKAVDDPQSRLRVLIEGHLRLILRDPATMTLLVEEEANLAPDHRVKIESRKRVYTHFLRDSVQSAGLDQENPQKSLAVDPTVATYGILGMIHWVVRWYSAEGRLTPDQLAHQLTHLAIVGLRG